jgi:hypothetical protein
VNSQSWALVGISGDHVRERGRGGTLEMTSLLIGEWVIIHSIMITCMVTCYATIYSCPHYIYSNCLVHVYISMLNSVMYIEVATILPYLVNR